MNDLISRMNELIDGAQPNDTVVAGVAVDRDHMVLMTRGEHPWEFARMAVNLMEQAVELMEGPLLPSDVPHTAPWTNAQYDLHNNLTDAIAGIRRVLDAEDEGDAP